MQKWEYNFVKCEFPHFIGKRQWGEFKPRYVNGQELPNWKQGDLSGFIRWMGDQGWELVSVIPEIAGGSMVYAEAYTLVFKRPKA